MRLTRKEALQLKHYYKLINTQNGATICRSSNLNEIKKDAYAYDNECNGDCAGLRCIKYESREIHGTKCGYAVAEYNPNTKKFVGVLIPSEV